MEFCQSMNDMRACRHKVKLVISEVQSSQKVRNTIVDDLSFGLWILLARFGSVFSGMILCDGLRQ